MAKKPSPEKPAPSSLLPGFQHLIPSAAAAPLAAHVRPLFLPDLVQQLARNKQIDANRREQAHPVFRKWAQDLKQGILQQLHETQVEQDFNNPRSAGLELPQRLRIGAMGHRLQLRRDPALQPPEVVEPRAPRAPDRAGRPGQVRRVLRDLPCRQPAGNRHVRPEHRLAAPRGRGQTGRSQLSRQDDQSAEKAVCLDRSTSQGNCECPLSTALGFSASGANATCRRPGAPVGARAGHFPIQES